MKVLKAVLKLYLYQFIMLVCLFVAMGPLWFFMDRFPIFYSFVMTIAYGCMIYAVGWNYGKKDGRKIPGSYPEPSFSVKVSVFASILPVCLFLIRFLAPDILPSGIPLLNGEYDFLLTGNRLHGTMDLIFKSWYFPFGIFLGNGRFWTYLLAVLALPVLFISGYFVGLTRFKLLDVLLKKLMFSSNSKK